MLIKKIQESDMPQALDLIWDSFLFFVAPDYTKEGVETFYNLLHNSQAIQEAEFWGAFENGRCLGVIASRKGRTHICFFFIKKDEVNKGIGKILFSSFLNICPHNTITVNSSPYAVGIYKKLGFIQCGEEQTQEGIVFTPMIYERQIKIYLTD